MLLLAASPPLQAANPVSLEQIGFYEGSRDSSAPDWGSAEIKTTFAKESARSIFTLIQLKNNLWLQSDQVFKLAVRYLHPDGSQISEEAFETKLPADWDSIELRSGWGWNDANHWDAGFYRVELWLDGSILIGDGQFFIKANTSTITVARSDSVEFEQMGFL